MCQINKYLAKIFPSPSHSIPQNSSVPMFLIRWKLFKYYFTFNISDHSLFVSLVLHWILRHHWVNCTYNSAYSSVLQEFPSSSWHLKFGISYVSVVTLYPFNLTPQVNGNEINHHQMSILTLTVCFIYLQIFTVLKFSL